MTKKYKNNVLSLIFMGGVVIFLMGIQADASTVAYWRFENGPVDTDVVHLSGTSGVYSADIPDVSGNGNDLSVWETGGGAGYEYRSDVVYSVVPLTGVINELSVKNTGGGPAMWCNTLQSWSPSEWTIEVTFKLENNGHKTIIGRDSIGTAATNSELAALYLQVIGSNALGIKFCDVDGYWHQAISEEGVFSGFDYSSDPDGEGVPWYSVAAASDGATLSLYLKEHGTDTEYQLITQTDMTTSGSSNTALTAGAGDGGDWDAGDFTIGRGLYGGSHGDRAYGFIDEVRLSDTALIPSDFLASEGYKNTVAYWRFEEGPVDSLVAHGGLDAGEFYPGVEDISGKGNHLSAWSEELGAHVYRDEAPFYTVLATGADNSFSVQNFDSTPGLFTSSADSNSLELDCETWQPVAFTIEASFKPEAGGYRTIVGRDGESVVTGSEKLAALYLQIQPDDSVAIKFADVSGYWHEAISDPGLIQYDDSEHWYHIAAVCDGNSLSLYLNDIDLGIGYQLVSETDMTTSSSPDMRLVADSSVGSNWHGGGWSVGRGLYEGGHTDHCLGYIDEVRLSSVALDSSEFLFYEEQNAGVAVAPADLTIPEDGSVSGDLFFILDYPPVDDVLLTIQEQNERGQVTLDQTTLLFTPGTWSDPQVITVTAVDDEVLENAEQRIPLSIMVTSSSDENYDGLEVDSVIVTVLDDECGAWGFALGDFNTDCVVDFYDFVEFAQGWLECSDPDQASCTDFSGL